MHRTSSCRYVWVPVGCIDLQECLLCLGASIYVCLTSGSVRADNSTTNDHHITEPSLLPPQTHTDVIVLTYAVYAVAAILPLSPIAVAPHLADLFEVFSRLVTWKDRGKAGV